MLDAADTVVVADVAVVRGRRRVLDVGALALGPGVTALVGPNGSGKSTLLHVIAGLLEPARGSVLVLGQRPVDVRRRIAYVLQTPSLSAHLLITAGEIVGLARAATLGPVRPLRRSDRAAVARAVDRLEIGPLVGRHLAELSGGQRQRVFVAQGLAQEADVLLLDEPVAGLDLPSAERIGGAIADERAAGRTIIIATHDLDEASKADRVVLLAGRVVVAGPPGAVLNRANLRAAYGLRLLDLGERTVAIDDGAHDQHLP